MIPLRMWGSTPRRVDNNAGAAKRRPCKGLIAFTYAMGWALTLARRTKRGRLCSLGSWVSPWISGSA